MKRLSAIFIALIGMFLSACNGGGEKPENEISWTGLEEQTVIRGDEIDLLAGITAHDKKDGDITSRIEIEDDGGFTSELAGGYEVVYSVTNSRGIKDTKTKLFTVKIGHNVANGNFDFLEYGWTLDTPGGAATVNYTNGKAVVRISNPGTSWWSVQLYQNNIIFEAGKTYCLTVKASSPEGRSLSAGFEDVNNGFRMMLPGFAPIKLSEETTEYSLYFTALNNFTNVKVVVYLGHQLEVDEVTGDAHTVVIEDIDIQLVDVSQNVQFKGVSAMNRSSGSGKIDLLADVTATDNKGNDVTDKIEVFGEIADVVKNVGSYLIQYRVTLDDGSISFANRKITVNFPKDHPHQAINGDFSLGFTGWVQDVNQTNGTGVAEYVDNKDGTVSVKVIDASNADWHIQLYQTGLDFKKGVTYTLRAVVKADMERKAVLEVVDPTRGFADLAPKKTIEITEEFQTFELTFTPDRDYYGIKISILLGNVDMLQPNNCTFTFDELQVYSG